MVMVMVMVMVMGAGMRNRAIGLAKITGFILAGVWNNFALAQVSTTNESETLEQAFRIKPRITLTETWTDNVAVGGSQNNRESGFITQLAPGVRIDAKTARLNAYLDYALTGSFYSTSSIGNRTQNALNTFGTLEAVSNWMYLDFSGRIAQQAISAFGAQSPSNASVNGNSTETSTYRISPYIRGQLAGEANYSLRYSWSTTQSNASTASNIEFSEWAGQLRGATPFQNLKWSINATQQNTNYSRGRTTEAERLYVTGIYTIVPQFRISVSGGQESNSYASQSVENRFTSGYGFDWTPTERTQISAFKERRFFGNSHRYTLSHRFPLTNIRYSDTKDVSVLPNQFATVGIGTVYDLFYPIFYQICSQNSQISSLYPDLDTCAQAGLSQLSSSPNTQVTSSFLVSRATVQRRQQLALGIQGTRNTVTVLFSRNESESILATSAAPDDFLFNNAKNIRQRGFSINLSHKLSADSRLNLMGSRQESTGTTSGSELKATTMMYQASLTSKLGAKTTGGITIRRTEFENSTTPYTENALIGTLSVIF